MPIYLLSLIESEEDRISLSRIYERYKKYLYAIALDISRDAEIADEALSETFVAVISVYEKIKEYEETRLKHFLRTVLKNKTMDFLNLRKKTILYSAELTDEIVGDEDVNLKSSDYKKLAAAMLSIKEEYREILILRYVDELDIADISGLLNISYENCKKRLLRARNAMKNRMEAIDD